MNLPIDKSEANLLISALQIAFQQVRSEMSHGFVNRTKMKAKERGLDRLKDKIINQMGKAEL